MEVNLRFKIDWANLILICRFSLLLCQEGNFQVQAPPGGLIFGGGACTCGICLSICLKHEQKHFITG